MATAQGASIAVRQDRVSRAILFGIIVINIFVLIGVASYNPWLIPFILAGGATILRVYGKRALPKYDRRIDGRETRDIVLWTVLPLAVLTVVSYFGSSAWILNFESVIASQDAVVFTVCVAFGEAIYFHEAIYSVLQDMGGSVFALFGSAGLGTVSHYFVYGNKPYELVYVAIGFFLMSLSVYMTRRWTSALISHIVNNVAVYVPYVMPVVVVGAIGVLLFKTGSYKTLLYSKGKGGKIKKWG